MLKGLPTTGTEQSADGLLTVDVDVPSYCLSPVHTRSQLKSVHYVVEPKMLQFMRLGSTVLTPCSHL